MAAESTTPALLGVGRMVVDPAWAAKRHSHSLIEMMVVFGGRLALDLGGEAVEAGPGDVLLYPPETAHEERAVGGDRCDFAFWMLRGAPAAHRAVLRDADGRIRMLVEWMLRERDARRQDVLDAALLLLLREYERLCARGEPTLADEVRAFLQARLKEPLTIDDIARSARMSRAHFMRTYKRATGRTPMQELRALRVAAARDLIVSSDLPLRAIAARVGLGDEHHLSHVFRRELRVAPGYFRRSR